MREIGFTSWLSRTMSLETALRHLASAECRQVEVAAMPDYFRRWRSISNSLRRYGMEVTAVSLGVPFYYSESRLDLHSRSRAVRESTARFVRGAVDFASSIEADLIYVCSMSRAPPKERVAARNHLIGAVTDCADFAGKVGVRFGVEPFPTGELPTIKQVDDLVTAVKSDNLGIVVDTGHAAISREPLAQAVRESSDNIMHVHLNNNDGAGDLHWPPQRGKLQKRDFEALFAELRNQRYSGKVSVELSNPKPVVATILDSRCFVQKVVGLTDRGKPRTKPSQQLYSASSTRSCRSSS